MPVFREGDGRAEETARIKPMSPLETGLYFLLGNVFPSIGLLLMLRGSHRVNMQVAYLKCGELVARALTPRLHSFVRRLYDKVGPILARRLRRPIMADIAYVCLKPAEWGVRLFVLCSIPEALEIAKRLYR